MRQETVKIPLYKITLTIILDDDLKYVQKKYKTVSLDNYGAVTLTHQDHFRHFIVAFTDKDHLSNIAHEIVHLKNYIFKTIGARLDFDNDEPEAYLTGYLFDLIYNFLHKE